MSKRIRPSRNILFDLYEIQGISPMKISEMYGVVLRTVYKWLKLYNIPRTHLNSPKIRPSKAKLHQWYWKEKWTLPRIAEHCGVSYPAVRAWFLKYNIPRRTCSEAQCLSRGTQHITKALLEKLYWEDNMSQSEIGERFNINQSAIKEKMKKFKIPARGRANIGPKNGMYGRTHTSEAIEKIREANRRQFSDPEARKQHAILSAKVIAEGRTNKTHTLPEKIFAAILDDLDIEYIWQHRISRYVYDFYLPNSSTLVEIQGTFWHADPRFYDHAHLNPIQAKKVVADIKKKRFATENGFNFLCFWEHDLHNSKQIILDALDSL